jgi:hypothetical protein
MKKYYLHSGNGQEGPFDVEELKAKNIDKNSPIWYEGLSEWTTAGKVEELKGAYRVSPPPFETKVQPPPLSKSDQEFVDTVKAQKPSSAVRVVGTIAIILIGIGGAFFILSLFINGGSNSMLKVTVHPPNPRVVETHSNEDPSSQLFAYRQAVYATVLNAGGSGNILVKAVLRQGDNAYEKSETIYLTNNETQELHFTFDEAKALGGDMHYEVSANAAQ